MSGWNLERLPAYCQEIADLETLILDDNNGLVITQDDIKEMSHLPIKKVSIRSSNISGETLFSILQLPNLTSLDISDNLGIGQDHYSFRGFKRMKSLQKLAASNTNLSVKSFNEICKCRNLRELWVSMNEELGDGILNFGSCKDSLVRLNIGDSDLNEASLKSICGLTKLEALNISWNTKLGSVLSRESFSFGNLEKTLVDLNMIYIGIKSASVFKAIGRCKKLVRLDASCNTDLWRGADEINFGCLSSRLRVLNVARTDLPPAVLPKIFGFGRLLLLDIGGNGTACKGLGTSIMSLGGMRKTLRNINAWNTGLSGKGLRWIFREFRGLREVDVQGNEAIRPADLMRLDFDILRNRLVKFNVTTDSKMLANLQEKLPLTWIH